MNLGAFSISLAVKDIAASRVSEPFPLTRAPRRPPGLLTLAVLAACTGSGTSESTATPSEPIFRYVELNVGRVNLAEQLPAGVRSALALAAGDTVAHLPRGSFARADRITLYLASDGRLRGAVFDYPTLVDFEAVVRDYASVGLPTRTMEQRRGEEPSEVVSWQDARTTFRLRRDPNRSAWTVRGELWDRALSASARR